MIPQWIGEVEAINVSQVIGVRDHVIRDLDSRGEVLVPLLHFGVGLCEGLASFLSELETFSSFFRFKLELVIKLGKVLGIFLCQTVRAIVLMTFGQLANIGLPAKVLAINESDGLVGLFTGLMLFVCVEPCC